MKLAGKRTVHAALALGVGGLGFVAAPAHAAEDSMLVGSSPGSSAVLYAAPTRVSLTFDRPVLPDMVVTVTDEAGKSWHLGNPTVVGETVTERTSLYAQEGDYVIRYSGHAFDGRQLVGAVRYRVESV